MKVILGYFIIINIFSYFIMLSDKHKAKKHQYRIKENTLFFLALIGGCYGSFLAMINIHHKNKKIKFWIIYICTMIIYAYILFKIIGG